MTARRLAMDPAIPYLGCSLCAAALVDGPCWEGPLVRLCESCCARLRETIRFGSATDLAELWTVPLPELSRDERVVAEESAHADLGLAYIEMGLRADALGEALIVARGQLLSEWIKVLPIVFDEALVTADILRKLRRMMGFSC